MKIMVQLKSTTTSQLMINITTEMKLNIFLIKIFDEITLFLLIICSFLTSKVSVSLSKSFHAPLDHENALNWPPDHYIDNSSTGLHRLIIQQVFNEVYFDNHSP